MSKEQQRELARIVAATLKPGGRVYYTHHFPHTQVASVDMFDGTTKHYSVRVDSTPFHDAVVQQMRLLSQFPTRNRLVFYRVAEKTG